MWTSSCADVPEVQRSVAATAPYDLQAEGAQASVLTRTGLEPFAGGMRLDVPALKAAVLGCHPS